MRILEILKRWFSRPKRDAAFAKGYAWAEDIFRGSKIPLDDIEIIIHIAPKTDGFLAGARHWVDIRRRRHAWDGGYTHELLAKHLAEWEAHQLRGAEEFTPEVAMGLIDTHGGPAQKVVYSRTADELRAVDVTEENSAMLDRMPKTRAESDAHWAARTKNLCDGINSKGNLT